MEDLESRLGEFISTPARQAATLADTGRRPMPLPEGEWIHAQTWENLLFAHWRVPPDQLGPHVPEELPLDTFDGTAWVGLTPFRISGLRARGLPPLPLVSSFLEVNVRTYVELDGKAGIYFFSFDAESSLACLFTMHENRVHWAQIHHPPWPLQPAELEIAKNTMPPPGFELSGDPVCHFSARQDVVLWGLEPFAS